MSTTMLPTRRLKRTTSVLLATVAILSIVYIYAFYRLSYRKRSADDKLESVKQYLETWIWNDSLKYAYDLKSEQKFNSYLLWKLIQLLPGEMTGNASHRRYGEPLELYSLPVEGMSRSDDLGAWSRERIFNHVVNCSDLFLRKGNMSTDMQVKILSNMKLHFQTLLKLANESCEIFLSQSGYINTPMTKMESTFPIAFSILVYTEVEQFEILLRTIYRPQNVYCIHIDKKSPVEFRIKAETIVNCFDNVFITSKSIFVEWGKFGVLEAEQVCLNELWKHRIKWKYFINLTGQELPLRTNYELVKILTAFNGANNVEATRASKSRIKKAGPPPEDLSPVKGATHVVLSRAFVEFVLHNDTGRRLLQWSRGVSIPDEIFFSTLSYNKVLAAPGAYRGEAETTPVTNPFLARLKNWKYETRCHGKFIRHVCIFGTDDLPLLATREELFVNKFNFGYHPEVTMCMQELLYNRTSDEYNGHLDFNVSYYSTRDFVKSKF